MTLARARDNLLLALDTLRDRKVRSGLTMIGHVLGGLSGVQPAYSAAMPLFTVAMLRCISAADEEHRRDVAVIGAGIADSLFPHTDPIGKEVRLDGRVYEIVGGFEKDPGLFGGFGV